MIFLKRKDIGHTGGVFMRSILKKDTRYWIWSGNPARTSSRWTQRSLEEDGTMFVVPFLLRDADVVSFLGRVAAGDNPSPGSEIVVLWYPRDSGWVAMAPIRVPLRPSVAAALPPCVAPEDLLALEVLTT